MDEFTRVEFQTVDGVTLRGNFFQADGIDRPIVVMTDGLTLIKEQLIDLFARDFREAGISALTYDHRGYGESEGTPRSQTNPLRQAEDYHDAVTAAMQLSGVDPARTAIWGIGHGAAAAIIAGADDPRVGAVVVQAPFYGPRDKAAFPENILTRAWQDREVKTREGSSEPTYVRVWPDSIENARGAGEQTWMRGEGAFGFIEWSLARAGAAAARWENRLTLQSFHHIARTDARRHIAKNAHPFLYVAAEDDPFSGSVADHRAAFDAAGPKAEFKVLPAQPNVDFAQWLKPAAIAHIEFLKRVL